jgi:hypothetical protein
MTMREAFGRRALRRWWVFVVLAGAGAAVAAVVVQPPADRAEETTEFVVRPAAGLSPRDVPSALDALQPTGSLMNTVLAVLGSDGFVVDAAHAAHVDPRTASIAVSLRPGSVVLDATTSTPTPRSTRALAAAFATRASDYVGTKFAAYSLERFSTTGTSTKPTRSAAQAIGAGVLLGLLLAAGLLAFSTWHALRRAPQPEPAEPPATDLTASRTKKAAGGATK